MSNRNIEITLNFTEEEVQEFLNAANYGHPNPLKLHDLSDDEFEKLKTEIVGSADTFKEEIIENSPEACANDWLEDFSNEDE